MSSFMITKVILIYLRRLRIRYNSNIDKSFINSIIGKLTVELNFFRKVICDCNCY